MIVLDAWHLFGIQRLPLELRRSSTLERSPAVSMRGLQYRHGTATSGCGTALVTDSGYLPDGTTP